MSPVLDLLAEELEISGRTLRRAASRGLIRAARSSERTFVVTASERAYLRSHWPLFRALLEALRKQPNVRLAVVFGSVARGQSRPESDLDLLVRLRRDDPQSRAELVDVLEAASGRQVQLVSSAQAEQTPLLLADVLADGRVLVDRDGDWPRLQRRRNQIARQAQAEDERLTDLAWTAPEALERVRSGMTVGSR
jgi:predicted nucleotidyltransferase